MRIKSIVNKIINGIDVDDVIAAELTEAAIAGKSDDFWRMVVEDIIKTMQKGFDFKKAVDKVSGFWAVTSKEIMDFLNTDKALLTKLKGGTATHDDTVDLTAKLAGSEEELDAYISKEKRAKVSKKPVPKKSQPSTGEFRANFIKKSLSKIQNKKRRPGNLPKRRADF